MLLLNNSMTGTQIEPIKKIELFKKLKKFSVGKMPPSVLQIMFGYINLSTKKVKT